MFQGKENTRDTFSKLLPKELVSVLKIQEQNAHTLLLTDWEQVKQYFTMQQERDDVMDFLKQVPDPVYLGLGGSRFEKTRPPLFPNVAAFDTYHQAKQEEYDNLQEYCSESYGVSVALYYQARSMVDHNTFNAAYRSGNSFPPEIVDLLVRDIDLTLIAPHIPFKATQRGKRTNVFIDTSQLTLSMITENRDAFFRDPELVGYQIRQTVPLRLL